MKHLIWLFVIAVTIICKDGTVYRLDDDYMVTDTGYWLGGDEPQLMVKLKKFKEKFKQIKECRRSLKEAYFLINRKV